MPRPTVVVHQTASLDGRLTTSPETLLLFGDERWNAAAGSGEETYQAVKALHKPQAILEGSGSFALESAAPPEQPSFEGDPAPLYQDFLPENILKRPGQRGWFTVVDSRGRVQWAYKEYPGEEWQGWYPLVLVARCTSPAHLAYLQREDIPYLVTGEARVDLQTALEKMGDLLGVTRLVSTAGGRLNGALLRLGLVDEVNLDFFPALIGGRGTPALFDAPPLTADQQPVRLKFISAQVKPDGRLWLRYQVGADSP